MSKLYIGTSGFSYRDWIDKFYPDDLPSTQWLEYYSQHFKTVELNSTFYRLPGDKTFINWKKRTPKDFIFSVKANQYLTHWHRLKVTCEDCKIFEQKVSLLGEKLGVILFQLPPSMKKDADRLAKFLKQFKTPARFAFEFRHPSWFDKEIYKILKAFNCAMVFHDAQQWPPPPFEITADFIYIRFHGVEAVYNYEYSKDQLENWQLKIGNWLHQKLDIFAYFNNDVDCFAVKNAKELIELVNE